MPSTPRQNGTVALVILELLTSCQSSPPTSQTSPTVANEGLEKVVVTSTVLCDMTKYIAANTVDLTCLIKPGADPHVYEPTPEDRKAIEDAKLILYGGYNFEPSLIKLINATSKPVSKVAVSEMAVPNPQQFEEDSETETDPHVWQNAKNGVWMVEVIEANLAKIAPDKAGLYAQNAQTLTKELIQIDGWIKTQIATIPQASRKLVTTHDALGYYATAYGIPVEGALQGISTEEKPTASRVKALVKTVEDTKVPTIFAELTINPKLIEAVAKEANVKVSDRELFADSLGELGSAGDAYPKMLIANTRTIVEGLGGKFTPFQLK